MLKFTKLFSGLIDFFQLCSSASKVTHYASSLPEFRPEQFFQGDIRAWGIIQDWRGKVTHRFHVDIHGVWQDGKGVLNEKFTYLDQEFVQERQWNIVSTHPGHYEGRAGDIIGIAKGQASGNAMYWQYKMDVPVGERHYRLKFDDWIWAMDDQAVINRSTMKKFGLPVAELTIFMQKYES